MDMDEWELVDIDISQLSTYDDLITRQSSLSDAFEVHFRSIPTTPSHTPNATNHHTITSAENGYMNENPFDFTTPQRSAVNTPRIGSPHPHPPPPSSSTQQQHANAGRGAFRSSRRDREKTGWLIIVASNPDLRQVGAGDDGVSPADVSAVPSVQRQQAQQNVTRTKHTDDPTTHSGAHDTARREFKVESLSEAPPKRVRTSSTSSNDPNMTEEERRFAKLEKNRQSARDCRKRKKQYVHALELSVSQYKKDNADLRRRQDELEQQNKEMLEVLRKRVPSWEPTPTSTVVRDTDGASSSGGVRTGAQRKGAAGGAQAKRAKYKQPTKKAVKTPVAVKRKQTQTQTTVRKGTKVTMAAAAAAQPSSPRMASPHPAAIRSI